MDCAVNFYDDLSSVAVKIHNETAYDLLSAEV
jgi:hypothetical protein